MEESDRRGDERLHPVLLDTRVVLSAGRMANEE